ncbi:MAG: ATP-binding cassette domain-containing protein [Chloroflexi bacterium]|nr:ATP-binding cassette domain-containing protein [Chloroflexota bacterium]
MMTVRENLELGAYPPRAHSKRAETIERVFSLFPRLAERAGQLGGTLSGGEQQMLAIGRALMALPELLILNEVSLGLAPLIIDDLYRAIREINAVGVTVLLVERHVHHSLEMAHRAYIIERGRIMLSGATAKLKQNKPQHSPGFSRGGDFPIKLAGETDHVMISLSMTCTFFKSKVSFLNLLKGKDAVKF